MIFNNSHGFSVEVVLDDNTRLSFCTYDVDRVHAPDDFYVGLNQEEL